MKIHYDDERDERTEERSSIGGVWSEDEKEEHAHGPGIGN